MLLSYVDASGDPGMKTRNGRLTGSSTLCIGCVTVEDAAWLSAFDELIGFRRFLKKRFRLPIRAEVKANHLVQNTGAFRPLRLSESARFAIYRSFMRLQSKVGLDSFAILVRKDLLIGRTTEEIRKKAWELLVERLERRTTKARTFALLVHDEGDEHIIRAVVRKARRAGITPSAFGTGQLKRPAQRIIDDPVSKESHASYFLQIADLVAYAAFGVLPENSADLR